MKTSKFFKTIAVTLVIAMLASMAIILPASAVTPTYTPDATWGADEDGVYRIYDAADLLAFNRNSSANSLYEGKTVKLMADIDLNPGWDATTKTVAVNQWQNMSRFNGVFDGNGHTIRGIYYVANVGVGGIFGQMGLNDGSVAVGVHDLRVENSYVNSTRSDLPEVAGTGFFFGMLKTRNGQFERVYLAADVIVESSDLVIGGFGARFWLADGTANATFTDCVFAGKIISTGTKYPEYSAVGGIMGNTRYDGGVTFERCAFTGTITTKTSAGGILGKLDNRKTVVMKNCVSTGTITTDVEGAVGAFTYLDHRTSRSGNPGEGNFSKWTLNATFEDCYRIGDMPSFGYAMKDGAVYQYLYEVGTFNLTVKYSGESDALYKVSEIVLANGDLTAVSNAIKKVTDAKALLALNSFAKWTVDIDGTVIPSGLATTMLQVRTAGYQVSAPVDNVFAIRMVSVIDDISAFSAIGYDFRIVRNSDNMVATGALRSSEVYDSILAAGDPITAESLNGNKIFALAITNIPTTGSYTITIKPLAVSLAGDTVYGSDIVITVIDGVVQNGEVA